MLKGALAQMNRSIFRYNNRTEKQSMWNFLHRWDYEHTLTKNILKVMNKILKELNKYHVFRWDWMVGLLGCAAGMLANWLEDTYYNAKTGAKPLVSSLVISGVLRNAVIKDKLRDTLKINVFTN